MREAAAKNRQPPPPPPPRFYSLNRATGSIITNDGSNNSSDNMSKNSINNDLISVLSPNLKSYLDKSTLSTRAAHNDKKQNNHPTVSVVVRTPHPPKEYNERHDNNNNETIEQEEEVYSPHLAALSSPPLQYTHYYQHDDDGLLHSIFSAKKEKKQQKRRSARRRRRIGRHNDVSKKKIGHEEEEEDILELFSPGVQEFDLDEAMAANSKGEDTRSHNGALEEGGGGQDEMTLDSVDRIVRGDYLKCRQITNSSSGAGGVSVEAATMSFTSPTPTGSKLFAATTTTPPTATAAEEVAARTTATTTTTTPVMDNTMVKTPTYSTPYNYNNNNDEDEYEHFYTPVQTNSDNTTNYNRVVQSTTSQVLGGGGGGSLSSLLAPVWEAKEKEELHGEQHDDEKKNDKVGDSLSGTPLFQTPKEYKDEYSCSVDRRRGSDGGGRVRWNNIMVEQEEDEDAVREEFFSPLAVQHCDVGVRTPNQQQQQQQQHITLENESYNDTIIEEWTKNSMEVVANEKMGGTNHQQQWQQQNVASPKYSEMREELQQILVEAKKLTPCKEEEEEEEELALATQSSPMSGFIAERASNDKENVQPTTLTSPEATRTDIIHTKTMSPSATPTEHHSLNYSPTNTTPNSHHHHYHHQSHSSSIIIVPHEHLTLDFVKQCDCLDTLKEILSRLSLNNRYPSMVRYVEKRIKIVAAAASASLNKAEDVDELAVVERQHQVVEPVNGSGEVVGNEGVDKENVLPEEEYHDQKYGVSDANIQEGRRSVPPPLETSSLSQSSREERNEVEYSNNEWSMHHRHRQITPENQSIEERSESIMTHETSLDMNLSESLDDESFFWRQDGGDQGDQEKAEPLESQPMMAVEHFDQDERLDARNEQYVGTDTAIAPSVLLEENSTPPESHTELQEKLASSLAAHAQLTERVESLIKEHAGIKAELTLKLDQAREQLSQRQSQASAEKEEYTKQVSHLIQVNETLEQEISSLKKRLEVVDKNAVDAASQAELQLDQTRLIQSKLSKENERLGTELDEARQARDRAEAEALRLEQILDERVANADTKDSATKRIRKGLEAAKFANHALANALAISEKDLSEALHQKEKSARECNSLQERIAELEDKSSWLSSKVNEMTKELQSSHKYIDTLYADLKSTRSPSKEMKAELERKELQWLELEHHYTRRIQELERQIASGGSKISMADYVAAVRESRMHQSEALQKQRMVDELESTVSTLKQQIETMRRRPSPRNGNLASMTSRGKSISNLGNYGKKVHNSSSVRIENDENKAPLGDMGGKKIRRTAALKAVGGRKGLSEQLRRARRVGEEE